MPPYIACCLLEPVVESKSEQRTHQFGPIKAHLASQVIYHLEPPLCPIYSLAIPCRWRRIDVLMPVNKREIGLLILHGQAALFDTIAATCRPSFYIIPLRLFRYTLAYDRAAPPEQSDKGRIQICRRR